MQLRTDVLRRRRGHRYTDARCGGPSTGAAEGASRAGARGRRPEMPLGSRWTGGSAQQRGGVVELVRSRHAPRWPSSLCGLAAGLCDGAIIRGRRTRRGRLILRATLRGRAAPRGSSAGPSQPGGVGNPNCRGPSNLRAHPVNRLFARLACPRLLLEPSSAPPLLRQLLLLPLHPAPVRLPAVLGVLAAATTAPATATPD